MAARGNGSEQLERIIRVTLKTMGQASAHQVWTWAGNRENNLLDIEQRMREMADAGTLSYIPNSFPLAYRLGGKRRR